MKSSSIATPTPDLQQYQLGRNLAEISDLEQRTKIPSENKKYNDTIQPACSATETSTHTKIPVCIDGLSIGVSGVREKIQLLPGLVRDLFSSLCLP